MQIKYQYFDALHTNLYIFEEVYCKESCLVLFSTNDFYENLWFKNVFVYVQLVIFDLL